GEVKCIDDEIPFEIPAGWEWCRFGQLVNHSPDVKCDDDSMVAFMPMKVIDSGYDSSYSFETKKWKEVKNGFTKMSYGDIAYAKITPCFQNRKSFIFETPSYNTAAATTELNVIRIYGDSLSSWYILYLLKSEYFIKEAKYKGTAGQQRVLSSYVSEKLIPVPPFSEQVRIVKKIKEVLPFADKYGLSQMRLEKLNDNLYPTLKKSILQEAIQGRLVPQDPAEEPASVLLEQIRLEKQRLLKEGKLKKKDITDSIIFKGDDNKYYERIGAESIEIELPFSFPESWEIVKLHSICALIDGEKRTGNYICLDAKYLRGKSSGEQMTEGRFVHSGDNIILVDGENSGEVFTAPIDGYMGSTFKQLWVSETLHLPYVLACIRFYKDELRNSKKGAAIPHLNKDIFRNLIIGIPPLQEQERIIYKFNEIEKQL
ncbi:MAG: restriction endonuclease subunit S, partial [Phocaeicola sp.]